MALEFTNGLMDHLMKGTFSKIKSMEKELSLIKMANLQPSSGIMAMWSVEMKEKIIVSSNFH